MCVLIQVYTGLLVNTFQGKPVFDFTGLENEIQWFCWKQFSLKKCASFNDFEVLQFTIQNFEYFIYKIGICHIRQLVVLHSPLVRYLHLLSCRLLMRIPRHQSLAGHLAPVIPMISPAQQRRQTWHLLIWFWWHRWHRAAVRHSRECRTWFAGLQRDFPQTLWFLWVNKIFLLSSGHKKNGLSQKLARIGMITARRSTRWH